jgi:polysaccharide biosynthesis transport protein
MEIRAYTTPLIKWWWLILLSALLTAGSCYYLIRNQPLTYSARSTLMIGRTITDPNPTNNEVYMAQQLASFYADLANRDPIRVATMNALGYSSLPAYRVNPLTNSQMIEIVVTDTQPERAANVANELANQLIHLSPTNALQEDQTRQGFVQQQLDTIQLQITDTQKAIDTSQGELASLTSAHEIAAKQDEIQALQSRLNIIQTNYANLLNSGTQQGTTNVLSVIEPAAPIDRPVGLPKMLIVAIAGIMGMFLAGGGSYLLEYVDDTLKTPNQIGQVTNQPLIGFLTWAGRVREGSPYVAQFPRSPITEGFRSLRAQLELKGFPGTGKILLVTSSEPSDGKTFVVANLAAILAQAGKQVIVLDADLRKPTIHQVMGVPNERGLQGAVRDKVNILSVMVPGKAGIKGVITAGPDSESLTDALDGPTITNLLATLQKAADLVIVDSPPIPIADAITWATSVDGVLFVVRPGRTHRVAARLAIEQLRRSGASIVGVVVNGIRVNSLGYGYSYNYHTYSSHYARGNRKEPGPAKFPNKKSISENGAQVSAKDDRFYDG